MNESTERLVAALRECNDDGKLNGVIAEAVEEKFHDYHPNGYTLPQHSLMAALRQTGSAHTDLLIERIWHGEFDGTQAEARAWFDSDEGKAAFAQLMPKAVKYKDTTKGNE